MSKYYCFAELGAIKGHKNSKKVKYQSPKQNNKVVNMTYNSRECMIA